MTHESQKIAIYEGDRILLDMHINTCVDQGDMWLDSVSFETSASQPRWIYGSMLMYKISYMCTTKIAVLCSLNIYITDLSQLINVFCHGSMTQIWYFKNYESLTAIDMTNFFHVLSYSEPYAFITEVGVGKGFWITVKQNSNVIKIQSIVHSQLAFKVRL